MGCDQYLQIGKKRGDLARGGAVRSEKTVGNWEIRRRGFTHSVLGMKKKERKSKFYTTRRGSSCSPLEKRRTVVKKENPNKKNKVCKSSGVRKEWETMEKVGLRSFSALVLLLKKKGPPRTDGEKKGKGEGKRWRQKRIQRPDAGSAINKRGRSSFRKNTEEESSFGLVTNGGGEIPCKKRGEVPKPMVSASKQVPASPQKS